ncbi:MAG: cyclopropane-fatty-acyl-phospholipid synthase family protein [Acidimicrobiia bacterium]
MTVSEFLGDVLGSELPVRFRAYDGSAIGPAGARTTVVVQSSDALRRIATAPDELGFGRAYVAGDFEIDGDVFDVLQMLTTLQEVKVRPAQIASAFKLLGMHALRPLPPPPEEARLRGRRHSKARDAAAISFHYDVSNEFYRIVLGPSLTYSCAVWTDTTTTLEAAQANKHELVARKLGLRPGTRLLDIGCGWGGMVLHAARHHGVHAVGVTLSKPQADHARIRAKELHLDDVVEIRHGDYRDITDGPYDAVTSIGMFEHVGLSQLADYFERCHALLAPQGRFVNHGISRAAHMPIATHGRFARRGLSRDFTERYVFPDGELHEVGAVVSAMQAARFEVRHVESLREHYALTLRQWVKNLEADWSAAVREAGAGRARVWRLYMAAAALGFEQDEGEIHQVMATKTVGGDSGLPLRPSVALPDEPPPVTNW